MQVLTVNIHKGYDVFNTRSVLHGLRNAVRAMGSDIVFLQEVKGGSGPSAAQYEFLADEIWPQHAYGRNAVAEGMDHGNAVMSRFPVLHNENHDLSAPSGLREVFRQAHGHHARSFPSGFPLLRLDRIYVRGVARALPVPMPRRPWARLSDHAPLAAEIHLETAP